MPLNCDILSHIVVMFFVKSKQVLNLLDQRKGLKEHGKGTPIESFSSLTFFLLLFLIYIIYTEKDERA